MTFAFNKIQLITMNLMMVAFALGLLGCNNQIQPVSKTECINCSNGEQGTNPNPSQPPAPVDPWQKIEKELTGYSKVGGSNQKLIGVDKGEKAIVLTIPFADNVFPEMEVEITKLPGAKVVSRLNSENKTELQFHVPIKYLLKGADFGNPQRLPNGDPLPSIPGGELPGFELNFPVKDVVIHVYLGAEVLGIYVEVPFDPYVKLTFPIKTSKEDGSQERTLGYLTSVPVKKPYRGGFFLSLLLPPDLARALDELLNSPE